MDFNHYRGFSTLGRAVIDCAREDAKGSIADRKHGFVTVDMEEARAFLLGETKAWMDSLVWWCDIGGLDAGYVIRMAKASDWYPQHVKMREDPLSAKRRENKHAKLAKVMHEIRTAEEDLKLINNTLLIEKDKSKKNSLQTAANILAANIITMQENRILQGTARLVGFYKIAKKVFTTEDAVKIAINLNRGIVKAEKHLIRDAQIIDKDFVLQVGRSALQKINARAEKEKQVEQQNLQTISQDKLDQILSSSTSAKDESKTEKPKKRKESLSKKPTVKKPTVKKPKPVTESQTISFDCLTYQQLKDAYRKLTKKNTAKRTSQDLQDIITLRERLAKIKKISEDQK